VLCRDVSKTMCVNGRKTREREREREGGREGGRERGKWGSQ
jgi:hypothetical protein